MDFKATIDLIIKDLNEASEIIDDLKKYQGVPLLQVELAKSKCRSAAQVIALLKNLREAEPVSEHQEVAQKKNPAKIVEEPITHGPTVTVTPGPTATVTSEPSITVADKFTPVTDFYAEKKVTITTDKNLSDRLKTKIISRLTDAIGLNDRFLFISEIFEGNKDAYNQAISKIEKAENLQDAIAIVMGYAGEKTENEAVIQLVELVKLKYPSNE